MNLDVLINDKIDLPRLAEVLDGLGHPGRVDTILHWDKRTQERLFEAAKGFRPLTLDHFVPAGTDPLVEVIHWGKNSLPAFTHFQKRFCKPKPNGEAHDNELWGYNHNSYEFASGPGYFVLHPPERKDAGEGELDIDYFKVPPSKPDAWPAIKPNESGLSNIIYAKMIDVMRGISEHVSIGRAIRGGKFTDNWFVLCREDPKPS
jgi:hypothetical protein